MGLLDIRQGKLVHLYKGFAGGIRSVQCHATKPVVASCGLDRFLRIHDIESKALLFKVYMKSRLNCVAMTERWGEERDTRTENSVVNKKGLDNEENDNEDDNGDIDDVWDTMEVIKTRTVKKSGQGDIDAGSSRQKKRKSETRDSENNEIPANSKKLKHKTSRTKKKSKTND